MSRGRVASLAFAIALLAAGYWFWRSGRVPAGDREPAPPASPFALPASPRPAPRSPQATKPAEPPDALERLRTGLRTLLGEDAPAPRPLDLPPVPSPEPDPTAAPEPSPDTRARGRAEREHLPLAVALGDGVTVRSAPAGEALYALRTGDFVRVYAGEESGGWIRVHPGVNVFLAETTGRTEPAGTALPDRAGWVSRAEVHVFDRRQAELFTETAEPVTLGDDPTFSMLSFYERAMANPDPVVHRVMGPRVINIISLHDDYVESWSALLRDRDSKIRSVTLAAIKRRGVGGHRWLMEDLIQRLADLTATRATGEREAEVLAILAILNDAEHPRVPAALQSFLGTWSGTQGPAVLAAARAMLPPAPPAPSPSPSPSAPPSTSPAP